METVNSVKNTMHGIVYSDSNFDIALQPPIEHVGALLAWNTTNNTYVPASADWTEAQHKGVAMPSDSAYVIGVLVAGTESSGTVLSYGCIEDPATIAAILNYHPDAKSDIEFRTGPYYLGFGGKAIPVADVPSELSLPVYCFTYTSTGKLIFNPRVPERYGHNHGAYDLAVADFDANGLYTPPNNSQVTTALNANRVYLFKNGELLTSGMEYTLVAGTLKLATPPVAGDVIKLFTVSPTVGFEPLVRGVTIATDSENLLEVNTYQGDVELSFKGTADTENRDKLTGVAVLDLANGVTTGPVVQQIIAGAGVSIAQVKDAGGDEVKGTYQVSANNGIFDHRDMQVCNLDGVLFGVDATKIGYVFPANVASSMHGTFRIPHFDSEAGYSLKLHTLVVGASAGYPDLKIYVTAVGGATETLSPTEVEADVPLSELSAISGNIYELSTELKGVVVKPDSLLICRLTCPRGSNTALTVLGVSISLEHK